MVLLFSVGVEGYSCKNKFRRFSQLHNVNSVLEYGPIQISSANHSLPLFVLKGKKGSE